MNPDLKIEATINIEASLATVWDALVNPAIIKQYLFGTEAISDWKVGSSLIFRGAYEGTKYEDKGTILQIEDEKVLQYTYLSSFSGLPDVPENYGIVTMVLEPNGNYIQLQVTQSNMAEERLEEAQQGWEGILKILKELLEK